MCEVPILHHFAALVISGPYEVLVNFFVLSALKGSYNRIKKKWRTFAKEFRTLEVIKLTLFITALVQQNYCLMSTVVASTDSEETYTALKQDLYDNANATFKEFFWDVCREK